MKLIIQNFPKKKLAWFAHYYVDDPSVDTLEKSDKIL